MSSSFPIVMLESFNLVAKDHDFSFLISNPRRSLSVGPLVYFTYGTVRDIRFLVTSPSNQEWFCLGVGTESKYGLTQLD